MATKKEIEQEINSSLGTEIEWRHLRKDDLAHLRNLVNNGILIDPMLRHVIKEHGSGFIDSKLEEAVEEWHPGKYAGRIL